MLPFMPPATRALIFANIAVFLLQQIAPEVFQSVFALWPLGQQFQPWQVVTYAFLHANLTHIFFNMLALYMFGGPMESFWGSRRFLTYYFICVLAAAATQLAVQVASHTGEPVLGASGGVFGLLFAFGWYFPRQRILLLFPPIPMPAWVFVTLYGALELVLGVTGAEASVAHFAHLGGMLGGAVVIFLWSGRDGERPRTRRF